MAPRRSKIKTRVSSSTRRSTNSPTVRSTGSLSGNSRQRQASPRRPSTATSPISTRSRWCWSTRPLGELTSAIRNGLRHLDENNATEVISSVGASLIEAVENARPQMIFIARERYSGRAVARHRRWPAHHGGRGGRGASGQDPSSDLVWGRLPLVRGHFRPGGHPFDRAAHLTSTQVAAPKKKRCATSTSRRSS